MAAKTNCPYCGKLTDPELDNCPHCGGPMKGDAPESRGGDSKQHCPGCGAPVQDGDIVCVSCGTNLITGQKITEQRQPAAATERNYQPLLIVGTIAIILLVIFGGVFLALQDPVEEALQLSQDNRVLDAINVLTKHLDQNPDDERAQFLLGQLYWRSGQHVPAAKAFDAAHLLEPTNQEAGMLAVMAYAKQPNDAGQNGQLSALKRLADQAPDDARIHYLYAVALGNAGDYAGQREQLEAVLRIEPGNTLALRGLGIAEALAGNFDAAAAALQEALRGAPEYKADTETVMGLVANLQDNPQMGEQFLQQAVSEESGTRSLAQARLGLLYMAQGNYDDALPQLREARRNGDQSVTTRFFHALCLEYSGLDREALEIYSELVDEEQGQLSAEAAVQMAHIYMKEGNDTKAREAVRRATQIGGVSARLSTVQGQINVFDGELGEAMENFRRAMRDNPDYAPAHLESGLLRIRRGQTSEGLRDLERYLELAGEAPGGRTEEIRLLVDQLRQAVTG